MKKRIAYFSKGELILWGSSVGLILVSFLLFDREKLLTLITTKPIPGLLFASVPHLRYNSSKQREVWG